MLSQPIGNEIPDDLSMEIMNSDGKIVKQLALSDPDLIQIGPNSIQIYWDAEDEKGHSLPSGVYSYKLFSSWFSESPQGENMQQGKLVLIK